MSRRVARTVSETGFKKRFWKDRELRRSSWATWSPFQSKQVREICSHMTDEEVERANEMSRSYGASIGAGFVWPMAVVFVLTIVVGPAILYAAAPAFFVVGWFLGKREQRKSKEFLCSTRWARLQGISPNELKMYSIRR